MNFNGFKFVKTIGVVTLVAQLALGPAASTWAEDSKTSDSEKTAEKNDKKNSDPCKKQKGSGDKKLSQAAEYCAAAEAADQAAKKQTLLAGVHAGVAGLCLIPCASNAVLVGEITSGHVCSAAAIGAGVTDMITTQQFNGAVGTLMGAYGLISRWGSVGKAGIAAEAGVLGTAANKEAVAEGYKGQDFVQGGPNTETATKAKDAGKQAKGDQAKKDGKMSCFTAAVEAGTAIMNYIGAQNSKKSANENRKLAKELEDEEVKTLANASVPGSFSVGSVPTGDGSTGGGDGYTPGSTPPVLVAPDSSNSVARTSSKSMSDSCQGSGFRAELNCAVASGTPLPRGVGSAGFNRALEKYSGLPLDKLMGRGDPKSVIGAISGAALGPQKSAAVKAALDRAEADLRAAMGALPSTIYSGGGGGGGGGSEGGPDIGNAIGALMEGLQNKPEEASENGRNETFGDKQDATDGLEEDKTVSLFERISKRYRASSNRLVVRGYTSPQNQVLSR